MIISTVGVIGIAASHVIVGVLGWLLNTQISSARSSKAIKKIAAAQAELARLRSVDHGLVPGELVTENIPEVVMTSDQHFDYLKRQYPIAWKEYQEKHKNREILDRADRYILRLILAYEAGDLEAKIGHCTLDFANGDELWISNKYYAYGRLYRSVHNRHICFDSDHYTISPYTFLRIVDLEERLAEPVLHLTPIKVSNGNS